MNAPHNNQTWEGYSNRETWAICLALNNNQWMYKQSKVFKVKAQKEAAKFVDSENQLSYKQCVLLRYSEYIKGYITTKLEERLPYDFGEDGNDEDKDIRLLMIDLMGLDRVNWAEVTEDQLAK